jgi:GNAT superfamily N-acetyltransferase
MTQFAEVEITASIARLQAYLRHSAQQQYESVSVPPFTLFFHPTDALTFFNYAIPDEPPLSDLEAPLAALRSEFAARGRLPRFEFIEEYAPRLAPALRAAGFAEEARQQLMICTAATYSPAPGVPGLTLTELTSASTPGEARTFLTCQRRGFDPHDAGAATEADAEHLLRTIGAGRAFVAWLDGQPVGAGVYTAPFDGVTEVAGLATLDSFRRRGIATALTALAVRRALKQGVEVVCLSAADERAGRVYERVGFVRHATILAYSQEGQA